MELKLKRSQRTGGVMGGKIISSRSTPDWI